MPSLSKQTHDAMRGEEGPFDSLMVEGAEALPLPEAVATALIQSPGRDDEPTSYDRATFYTALGFAYALASLSEPFAPHDHVWALAIEAATESTVAYNTVGGEVVE